MTYSNNGEIFWHMYLSQYVSIKDREMRKISTIHQYETHEKESVTQVF